MRRLLAGTVLSIACMVMPPPVLAQQDRTTPDRSAPGEQSLADMARRMRKDKSAEIKMTAEEAKDLFKHVDEVLDSPARTRASPGRGW